MLVLMSLWACGVADVLDRDDEEVAEPDHHAVLVLLDNSSSTEGIGEALAAADLVSLLPDTWRLGLTTVSVEYDDGASAGVDPGELGTFALVSGAIASDQAEGPWLFGYGTMCLSTCWNESEMEYDTDFECTDPTLPVPEFGVSSNYLDCVCGQGAWEGHCGSGNEEGLEALLMSLCLGRDAPTAECSSYVDPMSGAETATDFDSVAEVGAHDLLAGADDLHVLVLTDEGDDSRRLSMIDGDPQVYVDLFAGLGLDPVVSVIGPAYAADIGDGTCLNGATPWGVERYQVVAELTGGAYIPLTEGDECTEIDVGAAIAQWAANIE